MAIKQSLWKRPLLVGGIGLSASLWLLESTHFGLLDGSTWLSAVALGSGVWWWRRRRPWVPSAPRPVAAPVVDRARVEAQLAEVRDLIQTLEKEAALLPAAVSALVNRPQIRIDAYEAQCQALATALDRTRLRGLVVGERRSGKSTLMRHLTTLTTLEPQAEAGVEAGSVVWAEGLPANVDLTSAETTVGPTAHVPSPTVSPALERPHRLTASPTLDDQAQVSEASELSGLSESSKLPDQTDPLDPNSPLLALDPFHPAQADLVLWVTDGDLTASALDQLRQHGIAGQGVILAFNKTDHYTPADQHTVLTQLQRQGESLPGSVAVVAVAADPRPITVRRHQADGAVEESQEAVPPHLADLESALAEVLQQGSTLVAATTLRQAEALRQRIQQDLNQVRRQRAMPLIDQLQWVAAAAAFANPVPTLDVLATVAINGQLIMDLGKIYGFTLSLEDAKAAATTLAELTVKLGLVEVSTQVLTAVLKGHFATYLAGGTVQGLSAAYLTRMAGLSLIDYFEQAALSGTPTQALSWEAIAQRLSTVIQQNRQITLLQNLVKQGIGILKPAQSSAQSSASSPALLTAETQVPITLTIPEALTVPEAPPHP